MVELPRAARLACWLNAWLSGRVSADAAVTAVAGTGAGHAVELVGPEPGQREPAIGLLTLLRAAGASSVSLALPVPGDPLGLGGPSAFNAESLETGEAVVVHGGGIGLIPQHTASVTSWHVRRAEPPRYLASVAEAGRALRTALLEAAGELAALDVASWRPDLADALIDLRRAGPSAAALPFASPDAARLASDALRAWRITTIAASDDGGATTSAEADSRARSLQPLERAARAAVVAAVSVPRADAGAPVGGATREQGEW